MISEFISALQSILQQTVDYKMSPKILYHRNKVREKFKFLPYTCKSCQYMPGRRKKKGIILHVIQTYHKDFPQCFLGAMKTHRNKHPLLRVPVSHLWNCPCAAAAAAQPLAQNPLHTPQHRRNSERKHCSKG